MTQMQGWGWMPPVVCLTVLAGVWAASKIAALLEYRPQGNAKASSKPFSCGEDFDDHQIQPDYSQFYSFAFFFTILHVVALMIATVPTGSTLATFALSILYLAGAGVGLLILLKKEK